MTIRPTDRPSTLQAYQCKITQSTGMAAQMQREIFFFRLNFNVYSDVDNSERARNFFEVQLLSSFTCRGEKQFSVFTPPPPILNLFQMICV